MSKSNKIANIRAKAYHVSGELWAVLGEVLLFAVVEQESVDHGVLQIHLATHYGVNFGELLDRDYRVEERGAGSSQLRRNLDAHQLPSRSRLQFNVRHLKCLQLTKSNLRRS